MKYHKIYTPLSWFYAIANWFRNWMFDFHMLKVRNFDVPMISIGSLTRGGSGKVPFIEYLIDRFVQGGYRIALISRGSNLYLKEMNIVSDGRRIYGTPQAVGDEIFQIAKKFPQVIIIVNENIIRAVEIVIERFHPSVILLDDCFQHRAIGRAFDIVVVNSTKPFDGIPLLPVGPRREPLSALRRANLLVYVHNKSTSTDFLDRIKKYVQVIETRYYPKQLVQFSTGEIFEPDILKGKPIIAFCGIANPNSFRETLQEIGVEVLNFIVYPNHYFYQSTDMQTIQQKYERRKAQFILTTEKDAIRLQSMAKVDSFPYQSCYFLTVELNIVTGHSILNYLLNERVTKNTKSQSM